MEKISQKFKSGSGIFIYGTTLMMLILLFVLLLLQSYHVTTVTTDVQNAADAIADGTAYQRMLDDDVNIKKTANKILKEINKNADVKVKIVKVTHKKETEKKGKIIVKVSANIRPIASLRGFAAQTVTCSATTEYNKHGYGGTDYVEWAIETANDNSHGYSQARRTGPDYDCSSFVYYSLYQCGYLPTMYPFTTYNERETLLSHGFRRVSLDGLQAGDILWCQEHTEIYIGNNQTVGAHSDWDGKPGDSSGNEVSVGPYYHQFTEAFRYEGG